MNENRLKLILLAIVVALVATACSAGDEAGVDAVTVEPASMDADIEQSGLGDGGAEREGVAGDDTAAESPDADPLGSGALTDRPGS